MSITECAVIVVSNSMVAFGVGLLIGQRLTARSWCKMYEELTDEYCYYIKHGKRPDTKGTP